MSAPGAALVLVPCKLRAGWLVSAEVSGTGQRIAIPDPARRQMVMALIQFHFVNCRDLYPTRADALQVAREIGRRYGGAIAKV